MGLKKYNIDKKKHDLFSLFMLVFSLLFYLFFAFYDGAVLCVDSPSYIEMNIAREPLYPMFLALFRFLFSRQGAGFYLTAAVFVQSILAAAAAWSLASYIRKEFCLNRLFSMAVLSLPLCVSALCRFAAARGSMYSSSILSEGIAIPFYLLFFRYLLEYLMDHSKRALTICCLFVFLLISTRKQMYFSLALLMIGILFVFFTGKKYFKGICTALLCVISVFLGNTVLDLSYNYALRGEFVRHSSDTRFITTIAFYTADREDCSYIEDPDIQDLFLEIYDICSQNGYLKSGAGKGWLNRVSHFGDHYDHIQIDTMWPMVNQFAKEQGGGDVVSLNKNADHVMNVINRSLIPHEILKIAGTFADNFLSGLVTTVAQRRSILIWYSLFLYLIYLLLLVHQIIKIRNRKVMIAGIFTLISVLVNVGLVSLVIFCQTRYTIYNMALFYISLLLMIHDFIRNLKGNKHAF